MGILTSRRTHSIRRDRTIKCHHIPNGQIGGCTICELGLHLCIFAHLYQSCRDTKLLAGRKSGLQLMGKAYIYRAAQVVWFLPDQYLGEKGHTILCNCVYNSAVYCFFFFMKYPCNCARHKTAVGDVTASILSSELLSFV